MHRRALERMGDVIARPCERFTDREAKGRIGKIGVNEKSRSDRISRRRTIATAGLSAGA